MGVRKKLRLLLAAVLLFAAGFVTSGVILGNQDTSAQDACYGAAIKAELYFANPPQDQATHDRLVQDFMETMAHCNL